MQHNVPNVLGFLAAPSEADCHHAVSLALLKVRSIKGMTCDNLAKLLDCSAETIRNASNEKTLLSFDSIARLCYLFPLESTPIHELWDGPAEQPTPAERFERIERELVALRAVAGRA